MSPPWNPVCITESRRKISDPSGYDFEITDTYCSAIAHWANADVYVTKKGDRRRTLLFEYGPVEIAELPSVRVEGDHKIVISVPWVGVVFARRHVWRGMKIEYEIGRVDEVVKETNLDGE